MEDELVHFRCFSPIDPVAKNIISHPSSKIIHFFRHGESVHNVASKRGAKEGRFCLCEVGGDTDAAPEENMCPFLDDSLNDSPLSDRGMQQARFNREAARKCNAQIVVVSPLSRALQTACIMFAPDSEDETNTHDSPRILAWEELRPQISSHRQSKRSSIHRLRSKFRHVDFSDYSIDLKLGTNVDEINDIDDPSWDDWVKRNRRETREEMDKRASRVLRKLMMFQEKSIAVVSHFTFFLLCFNSASDTRLIGSNPHRPSHDPAFLTIDASSSLDPSSLKEFLPVSGFRSLLIPGSKDVVVSIPIQIPLVSPKIQKMDTLYPMRNSYRGPEITSSYARLMQKADMSIRAVLLLKTEEGFEIRPEVMKQALRALRTTHPALTLAFREYNENHKFAPAAVDQIPLSVKFFDQCDEIYDNNETIVGANLNFSEKFVSLVRKLLDSSPELPKDVSLCQCDLVTSRSDAASASPSSLSRFARKNNLSVVSICCDHSIADGRGVMIIASHLVSVLGMINSNLKKKKKNGTKKGESSSTSIVSDELLNVGLDRLCDRKDRLIEWEKRISPSNGGVSGVNDDDLPSNYCSDYIPSDSYILSSSSTTTSTNDISLPDDNNHRQDFNGFSKIIRKLDPSTLGALIDFVHLPQVSSGLHSILQAASFVAEAMMIWDFSPCEINPRALQMSSRVVCDLRPLLVPSLASSNYVDCVVSHFRTRNIEVGIETKLVDVVFALNREIQRGKRSILQTVRDKYTSDEYRNAYDNSSISVNNFGSFAFNAPSRKRGKPRRTRLVSNNALPSKSDGIECLDMNFHGVRNMISQHSKGTGGSKSSKIKVYSWAINGVLSFSFTYSRFQYCATTVQRFASLMIGVLQLFASLGTKQYSVLGDLTLRDTYQMCRASILDRSCGKLDDYPLINIVPLEWKCFSAFNSIYRDGGGASCCLNRARNSNHDHHRSSNINAEGSLHRCSCRSAYGKVFDVISIVWLPLMADLLVLSSSSSNSNNAVGKGAVVATYGDFFSKSRFDICRKNESKSPVSQLSLLFSAFGACFETVHVLPPFPFSSDDGFSPVSYELVRSELLLSKCCDDDDDEKIDLFDLASELKRFGGGGFGLGIDCILNHCSMSHEWVKKALDRNFGSSCRNMRRFQNYFLKFDVNNVVESNNDLQNVVLARNNRNPWTELQTRSDSGEESIIFWTTYSDDQIDLNWRNDDILREFVHLLAYYGFCSFLLSSRSCMEEDSNNSNNNEDDYDSCSVKKRIHSCPLIRLDAFVYVFKDIVEGKTIALQEGHQLLGLFRSLLEVLTGDRRINSERIRMLASITNVEVPILSNYFGKSGLEEADLLYNIPLGSLLLYTIYSQNVSLMMQYLSSMKYPSSSAGTFLNVLCTHDAVSITDLDRFIQDNNETQDIQGFIKYCEDRGGIYRSRSRKYGGSSSFNKNNCNTPWEICIAYFDACLSDPKEVVGGGSSVSMNSVHRFLLCLGVVICLKGVPGIYLPVLFGWRNEKLDRETKSKEPRRINRPRNVDFCALLQRIGFNISEDEDEDEDEYGISTSSQLRDFFTSGIEKTRTNWRSCGDDDDDGDALTHNLHKEVLFRALTMMRIREDDLLNSRESYQSVFCPHFGHQVVLLAPQSFHVLIILRWVEGNEEFVQRLCLFCSNFSSSNSVLVKFSHLSQFGINSSMIPPSVTEYLSSIHSFMDMFSREESENCFAQDGSVLLAPSETRWLELFVNKGMCE